MKKEDLRIVFMGTPDFAVGTLKTLVDNRYNVVAVITMPDKPMGRHGSVLQPSAVKQYAVSQGLPVLQPEKLKEEGFLEELRSFHADLQIVVAFRMLPEVVWNMPPMGTFNLHASLLPQYRGAAPINWAIINGDKETGVTTFFLQHEIDTGEIAFQERLPIGKEDCVGDVHDRLMEMGAALTLRTVDAILHGDVPRVPQSELIAQSGVALRPAPKLYKENTQIDWNRTATEVHDFVRGLSPYPAAWTTLYDEQGKPTLLKIYESRVVEGLSAPGVLDTDGKTYLYIGTREGLISVCSLQLAGKKRMSIADFLRGHSSIDSYSVR